MDRNPTISAGTQSVLDAFRSVRLLGQRMWSASSVLETLALVREYALLQFSADAVMTDVRKCAGEWIDLHAIGDRDACARIEAFKAFAGATFAPALLDELHYDAVLLNAGDVITRSSSPQPSLLFAREFERALDVVNWRDVDYMAARLTASKGLTVHLAVVDTWNRREYNALYQAHLSAVADLASHALSGNRSGLGRRSH